MSKIYVRPAIGRLLVFRDALLKEFKFTRRQFALADDQAGAKLRTQVHPSPSDSCAAEGANRFIEENHPHDRPRPAASAR